MLLFNLFLILEAAHCVSSWLYHRHHHHGLLQMFVMMNSFRGFKSLTAIVTHISRQLELPSAVSRQFFFHIAVCQSSFQPADFKHGSLQKCSVPGEKCLETSCANTSYNRTVSVGVYSLACFWKLLSKTWSVQNVPFPVCKVPHLLWFSPNVSCPTGCHIIPLCLSWVHHCW